MGATMAIDTSWGAAVAIVDEGGTALARAESTDSRRHAEDLVDLIAAVRRQADAKIDLVAVGKGPAPYTGLRAGLVAARTYAQVWDIPVAGVCSLEVLARQAADVLDQHQRIVVVTDARRKEVYAGCYVARGPHDVACKWGPEVDKPAAIARRLSDLDQVVGPGAALYSADFPSPAGTLNAVDPAVLGRLARARLAAAGSPSSLNGLDTTPLYLRRPDVSVPAKAR